MKNCLVNFTIAAPYQYHNASPHHTAKSPGLENCEPRCITIQGLHSATEESSFHLFVNWNLFNAISMFNSNILKPVKHLDGYVIENNLDI